MSFAIFLVDFGFDAENLRIKVPALVLVVVQIFDQAFLVFLKYSFFILKLFIHLTKFLNFFPIIFNSVFEGLFFPPPFHELLLVVGFDIFEFPTGKLAFSLQYAYRLFLHVIRLFKFLVLLSEFVDFFLVALYFHSSLFQLNFFTRQ